jgi:hypothetical protein
VSWRRDPEGLRLCAPSARIGDPDFLEYSIVPEAAEEVVTVGGRKCVLCHAFCTVSLPPIQQEELVEDEDAG